MGGAHLGFWIVCMQSKDLGAVLFLQPYLSCSFLFCLPEQVSLLVNAASAYCNLPTSFIFYILMWVIALFNQFW